MAGNELIFFVRRNQREQRALAAWIMPPAFAVIDACWRIAQQQRGAPLTAKLLAVSSRVEETELSV